MVDNNTRSERINIKILEELDKIKVKRLVSYSKRIAYLLKYSNMEKIKFNKWLKEEINNGKK